MPILTSLLQDRWLSLTLASAGSAQVILTLLHIGGMPCPLIRLTGIPCPGCGLSRACAALLRGQWATSVRFHLFAPLFLMAILLFGLGALLPDRLRQTLIRTLDAIERKYFIVALLLVLLLLYWLGRVVYPRPDFYRLMRGGF